MSRILVFQHVAAEPLGTLDPLIRRRGHRMRFVNFEREPDAQPCIDRYQGLIVLGGPMNVEDQGRRAHLRTELKVIEAALRQDKPVLGICLGAQLLAHALGAEVRPCPRAEIGWYALEQTEAGRADPLTAGFDADVSVFQWHSRGFALPAGATRLAGTTDCANQAFRYGRHAWGLQFHAEVDQALVERWLAIPAYAAELEAAGLDQDAGSIRAHSAQALAAMQGAAERAYSHFLDQIGQPARLHTQAALRAAHG